RQSNFRSRVKLCLKHYKVAVRFFSANLSAAAVCFLPKLKRLFRSSRPSVWSLQTVLAGFARFSFPPISVRPLAGTSQNAGAEQILRASSLQAAGHCCQGPAAFQPELLTAQTLAKRRLKNSHEYCYAVTELFFGDCLNGRVCPFHGTSSGAFIGDGKHAEKFEAVTSLAE